MTRRLAHRLLYALQPLSVLSSPPPQARLRRLLRLYRRGLVAAATTMARVTPYLCGLPRDLWDELELVQRRSRGVALDGAEPTPGVP